MKHLILIILLLNSLSLMAQQKNNNKNDPKIQEARMMRLKSFLKVKGGVNTEALLKNMVRDNPGVNLDMEKSLVSSAYAEDPNPAKVIQYVNSIEDPIFKLKALTMAIELMAPIDNAKALDIATVKLEEAKRVKGLKALSTTFKIDPKTAYDEFINTYGKLLFKAGKYEEAYKFTSEAYSNIHDRDWELKENYAFLSSKKGEYKEALPILSKAVQDGKFDKRYIDEVRTGYLSLNPGGDADAYVVNLQKDFISKIKNRIAKLMISETAPEFVVKDINGKAVSLSDFKGKTIVLDFWATWCGPCVASFPAMQMAVNRYANDPDVKFLFIHTWENVADPLNDARDFLSRRRFNFKLYMDTIDPKTKVPPAITAFGAKGIPAKFIIDSAGRIRFKVEGFEGKDEIAAEELSQMIEMSRKTD